MIDAESGAHLWADRFDGDLSSLSDLRDAVTTRVTRSLGFELLEAENRRSLRDRPDNPDAVDYVLRAQAILNRTVQTKEDDAEARRLAQAALRLDPQNSEALITLAAADVNQVEDYLSDDRAGQLRRAEEEIDRALNVAPGSSYAHFNKARVLQSQKKTVEAIAEFEKRIMGHWREGTSKLYGGRDL